ncbi:UPF0182 family protein [Peptococcaceae bacterium]|nr:UPF0182 family protein [Peptococcaceae bacterium]
MSKKYYLYAAIAAVLVLLFSVSHALAALYVDWLWFKSLNYQEVFLTALFSEITLKIVTGILFFVFLFVNLAFTQRFILQKVEELKNRLRAAVFEEKVIDMQQPIDQIEQWVKLITKRSLTAVFLLLSIALAFITSSAFSGDWIIVQKFLNSTLFNVADPIFQKDISFYVFELPFYKFLLSFAIWTIVVTALILGLVYVMAEMLSSGGRFGLFKSTQARLHVSVLAGLFFVFKAIGFYLNRYDLLFSDEGVIYGAGFTDVNIRMLALKVLAVLSFITAVVIIVNVFMKKFNFVVYSTVGLIVTAVILNGIVPSLVERFIVLPNQFNKEEPYIAHNIKYTRKAYDLEKIETHSFPAKQMLSVEDIQRNGATINNIRLWDTRPLKQTYSQLQEMRLYYEFVDIDIDRYIIDGELRQVMLAARELNQEKLPAQAQTWVNQRLIYTHGYGITMSPVNEATAVGLPKFFKKDIPPKGVDDIVIKRPEIYFGERTDQYVIVNTKTKEFNYPLGDQNVFTTYKADSGINIGNFLNRAIISYVLSDYKIMFSGDITPESQILMHRNIRERVPKIAPFLLYDGDPYIVVNNDGKLYWIWAAYTVTDMFPYSEPFYRDLNYIRNSVKVVIDAYTGKVDFYIVDENDPLIKTYSKIFPDMFKKLDDMPEGLRSHIRYPKDLFKVQAQMYASYHMENTHIFYNKEDKWEIATEIVGGEEVKMDPYYTIIKLPGWEKPEFVLILPFTPTDRKNMIAWLAARSDGENYGRLLLYEFPKHKLIYGPMQIEARINQDGDISQQLTLWDQRGSSVIRGNLFVIPIEDSILYVEPLFLQAEKGKMPELRRVIVAHGDKIVMEPTLEQALQRLFGQQIIAPDEEERLEAEPIMEISDLIKRAVELYDESYKKLQQGNWAEYGRLQEQLREILGQLEESLGKQKDSDEGVAVI